MSAVAALVIAGSPALADEREPEVSTQCDVSEAGVLIVRSNADNGTVLIDNQPRGTLQGGTATIVLPKGSYRLAIAADGYRRKGAHVAIDARASLTKTLTLRSLAVEKPTVWKPVFFGALATSVGTLALGVYGRRRMQDEADRVSIDGFRGWILQGDDCGRSDLGVDVGGHFAKACSWHRRSQVALVAAGGLSVLTVVAGYLAFVRDRRELPPPTRIVGRKPHRKLAVLPTLTPEAAGASLQLDW